MVSDLEMTGRELGRYRIIKRIGIGATATVYLAEHMDMGRMAAIKILHPHLVPQADALERFKREARLLSGLDHPAIIRLYDFATEQNTVYLVCEYVDGRSLGELLNDALPFPPELSVPLLMEICKGLAIAHGRGMVHRDIKPENILLTDDGVVKIGDFGIARTVGSDNLTLTGALMGSPNYMSPEQVDGKPVSAASDVFALGILFYRLMTGRLPFHAESSARVFRNIYAGEFASPMLASSRVDSLASAVIVRALHVDPGQRFPDASALLQALEKLNTLYGFGAAKTEMAGFLKDPARYSAALPARLIPALISHARAALARKNEAEALAAINHVLALDGTNREAQQLISRVRRKGKFKRAAIAVCAALALTALLIAINQLHPFKTEKPVLENPAAPGTAQPAALMAPPPEALRPATPPRPARTPSVAEFPSAKTADTLRQPAETTPRPLDSAARAVQVSTPGKTAYGTLRLSTQPWAKVYIDDVYRGKTPFISEVLLPAGPHRVALVNPYCDSLSDSLRVWPDSSVERHYALQRRKAGGP